MMEWFGNDARSNKCVEGKGVQDHHMDVGFFIFLMTLPREFHAWLHNSMLIKLDVTEICAIWVHLGDIWDKSNDLSQYSFPIFMFYP